GSPPKSRPSSPIRTQSTAKRCGTRTSPADATSDTRCPDEFEGPRTATQGPPLTGAAIGSSLAALMLTAGVLSVTGSTPAFENVRRCERVSGAGRPGGRLTQRYDTERAPGGSTSDVRDAGAGAPTIR